MNDATGIALEADLQRALDQVVQAIMEVIPTSDVIDPHGLVLRWMANLQPEARARFLMLVLSEGWERRLGSIARAVLAGDESWSHADVAAAADRPATADPALEPT